MVGFMKACSSGIKIVFDLNATNQMQIKKESTPKRLHKCKQYC